MVDGAETRGPSARPRLRVPFAPLNSRRALRRLRLPHDRARAGRIARDDLPDEVRLDLSRIRHLVEPLRRPSEDIEPLRQKAAARDDRRAARKLEEGAAIYLMLILHVLPLALFHFRILLNTATSSCCISYSTVKPQEVKPEGRRPIG